MLAAVCFGTNNLNQAGQFYDKVFSTLGIVRLVTDESEVGYGKAGGEPCFWILLPFDKKDASHGNGTQIIFKAPDAKTVDQFYQVALDQGGSDEGAPGPRDYEDGYYGAYCRDLDGNKLHVFAMLA